MHRSSLCRESGSALLEATTIGSIVFLVVMAALSAAIDLSLLGGAARQVAGAAATHGSRHGGVTEALEVAEGWPGTVVVERAEGSIRVEVSDVTSLPHPDGARRRVVVAVAEVPLAPFRSDRE